MDTIPFAAPAYSTATLVLVGLLISTFILAGLISFLYWVNTRIRRSMKDSHDDWRVEQDIESGHTLHAEGIYGGRHPEEGGLHLKQEDPHPVLDAFKPGLKKNSHQETDDEEFESQKERNIF